MVTAEGAFPSSTHLPADQFVRTLDEVFAVFGASTQDSGNVSYGVRWAGRRYFVKTAGDPSDARPCLDFDARVALLRNAARLSASCSHPLLPSLHASVEAATGPALIYEWLDGELLGGTPEAPWQAPGSALRRFCALPADIAARHLDAIYDLHARLSLAGWIAVDFYDGCLIYDFAADRLGVVDLDMYREAPFYNEMGRMFGSRRFMAPEEFERGALIDERTTVFVMGRIGLTLFSDGARDSTVFRGEPALHAVLAKATQPDRQRRFGTVAEFREAWRGARAA